MPEGPPPFERDSPALATKAVDAIDGVVDLLHDRLLRPLLVATRAVVFGMLIAFVALTIAVLVAIAIVRLLDVYAFSDRVWASDALLGVVSVGVGVFLWSMRSAKTTRS